MSEQDSNKVLKGVDKPTVNVVKLDDGNYVLGSARGTYCGDVMVVKTNSPCQSYIDHIAHQTFPTVGERRYVESLESYCVIVKILRRI